ncbi:hypothetical protein [Pedobacter gandavensis]|uniref:hypothetical protein n=1 Tax=Pedobacter gandavensis TaxID=2679963 RepID=UPI002931D3CB|nr:hypothetical protein [Pedobacter gandavensis]
MKKFEYSLTESNVDLFFPHERIKTKVQVLTILLEATRFLLYNEAKVSRDESKLVLQIKKMSRIFFIVKKKYYSINFPFTFIINDDVVYISYKNEIELDSKKISDLLSILKDPRFNSSNCLDFVEPIFDLEIEDQENTWLLMKELLLMEDGYLRFDNDPVSYLSAKSQGKEHTHPENHLDIFYSNTSTFKIGLERPIVDEAFMDYLDTQTDCMYLKSI